MKRRRLIIIAALPLLLCLTASAAFGRAWTSYTGKRFYGEFSYNVGESVVFENDRGERVSIPFSDLTPEDRQHLFPRNREWVSLGGDSVEGRFDKLEGNDVWIETFDERSFRIPLSRLSLKDQSYVRRNSSLPSVPKPQIERMERPAASNQAVQHAHHLSATPPSKKPSLTHRLNQHRSYQLSARSITIVVIVLVLTIWGWKMKGRLGSLFYGVYMLMGLVQLAAILGGIEDWWGWPWWIAIFIAIPLAYIPVLGTVVGIMGAIRSFGWSPLPAILLFCWPYVLYFILFVGGGLSAIFSRNED